VKQPYRANPGPEVDGSTDAFEGSGSGQEYRVGTHAVPRLGLRQLDASRK
jgi:hypothetical protein